MNGDIAATIIDYIQTQCPQDDETPQQGEMTRLDELVLDSLELLELVFALESRYGVQMNEALLGEAETIADLAAIVEQAQANEAA